MKTTTCVVASYRYGHLAAHAIESAQGFNHVMFVDDGVGDCGHLSTLYPYVEYVLRDTNLGIVKNFQDMLQRVTTDRVLFLGADNWLREDTMELLKDTVSDIVTYDIMVVGDLKDEILGRHPGEVTKREGAWYWDRSGGHHGSMLYNVELAKEVGGYDSPPGRTIEDMVLYHRMLSRGATREHVPEGLLYYRRHKENFNPC